jgi:4-diphosphocytidyl-2-C-methyl-D-erythritol kinase
MDEMVVEEFAPAKVNLYLHVVGRRDDGYHLLDSLVVFAGVGDTLTFRPADRLTLSLAGPQADSLAAEPDNLVLRAARRLAEAAGIDPQAAITLTKRLPVASGIGGGSADAAAALRGLARLWGLDADAERLNRIGMALGADLPVCLRGRPAQMSGIGEVLAETPPLPASWLLLVNPRLGLATPAVFKSRNAAFSPPAPLTAAPADTAILAEVLSGRRNDLAAPAIGLMPVIADILAALLRTEACLLARMSGSGATCFGLYATEAAARSAARALAEDNPGWWLAPAPLLRD